MKPVLPLFILFFTGVGYLTTGTFYSAIVGGTISLGLLLFIYLFGK